MSLPNSLNELFDETCGVCEGAFHRLAGLVPPPVFVNEEFRYQEKTIEQAMVLKLSRVISGLHAVRALLDRGLYQEVSVLFRVLDELGEDLQFLGEAVRTGTITDQQRAYLESFYQEEFSDPKNPMASTQDRPTVSRRKIHAAIAASPRFAVNPSDGQALYQTVSKALSGYVHGASVHILDSYGGSPPRFHVSGMLGTPRQETYERGVLDYLYRGLHAVMLVASLFKEEHLARDLFAFRAHFEKKTGMTDWGDPDERVRKLRLGKKT